MLDTFFYLFLIITAILLGIGFFKKSVPIAFLGSVMLMATGMVIMGEGILIPSTWSIDANVTTIDTNFTLFVADQCPATAPSVAHCRSDSGLNALGQIFFYLGILGILASLVLILVTVKNRRN